MRSLRRACTATALWSPWANGQGSGRSAAGEALSQLHHREPINHERAHTAVAVEVSPRTTTREPLCDSCTSPPEAKCEICGVMKPWSRRCYRTTTMWTLHQTRRTPRRLRQEPEGPRTHPTWADVGHTARDPASFHSCISRGVASNDCTTTARVNAARQIVPTACCPRRTPPSHQGWNRCAPLTDADPRALLNWPANAVANHPTRLGWVAESTRPRASAH